MTGKQFALVLTLLALPSAASDSQQGTCPSGDPGCANAAFNTVETEETEALVQTRARLTGRQMKSAQRPPVSSSTSDSASKPPITESDKPPPGLLDEDADESAKADAELLAAHGYNFTDDALRKEGFEREWEFARERARRAALLRSGGHWERMSSSLHLYYDWAAKGLQEEGTTPTRWIYADFISDKVANHEYYATLVHRLGYVGYQSKLQDYTNKKYSQFQCSNWDSQKHNAGSKSEIEFCGEGVTCKRFGHEGSGWQTHIEAFDLLPRDGQRFAFAVNYEDAGNGKNRVTCWFKAPGFKGGKWFKQSVWVGPGGGGHGSHATSFLEQFGFDSQETSKIRVGLYGTIWGRDSWGPWKVMEKASSSCDEKVKAGWKKVDWGVKKGADGQDRWYLAACGCKNTWECPGEAACRLYNTGGNGKKPIAPPTGKPPTLADFETEVEVYLPAPPPKPAAPGEDTGTCNWVKHVGKYSGGYAGGISTGFDTPEEAMKKCIQLGKRTCKAVTCPSSLKGCTVRGGATLGDYAPETSFTLDDYNCDMNAAPAPTPAPAPAPTPPRGSGGGSGSRRRGSGSPPPAPPPGSASGGGDCKWIAHPDKFSRGYAGGVSTSFKTVFEAEQKCIELGKGTCNAVTCNKAAASQASSMAQINEGSDGEVDEAEREGSYSEVDEGKIEGAFGEVDDGEEDLEEEFEDAEVGEGSSSDVDERFTGNGGSGGSGNNGGSGGSGNNGGSGGSGAPRRRGSGGSGSPRRRGSGGSGGNGGSGSQPETGNQGSGGSGGGPSCTVRSSSTLAPSPSGEVTFTLDNYDCKMTNAPGPESQPPAPTPPAPAPTGDSAGKYQELLDAHNKYRCMHGVPLMTWNKDLEAFAQKMADKMAATRRMAHSSSSERRGVGGFGYVGENLAMGATGAPGVKLWYDEIKDTNGGRVSSFNHRTGHYTQVVWKGSTSLGCGESGAYLCCNYGPGGNMGGAFTQNVFPPSKSEGECAGAKAPPAAPTPPAPAPGSGAGSGSRRRGSGAPPPSPPSPPSSGSSSGNLEERVKNMETILKRIADQIEQGLGSALFALAQHSTGSITGSSSIEHRLKKLEMMTEGIENKSPGFMLAHGITKSAVAEGVIEDRLKKLEIWADRALETLDDGNKDY